MVFYRCLSARHELWMFGPNRTHVLAVRSLTLVRGRGRVSGMNALGQVPGKARP